MTSVVAPPRGGVVALSMTVQQSTHTRRRIEEHIWRERAQPAVTTQVAHVARANVAEAAVPATHLAMPDAPFPSAAAVPFSVEQLTDQVIRQLDHRLLAHRERLGRGAF